MDDSLRPAQDDEFHAGRDALVAAVEEAHGPDAGWVVAQVLDFKWNYLDRDLSRWTLADVEDILLGLYPAKVMVDDEDLPLVPIAFAALLRQLASQVPGHVPPLEQLAERCEQLVGPFVEAMRDPDNWSFGKRMWSAAAADGVDFGDEADVQRWIEGFNQRTTEERDAIIGPLGAPAFTPADIEPFPPVVLAPEAELVTLATAAPLVRRVAGLVEYIGDGRPVTDKGNLKLADGKALVELLATCDPVDERIGDRVFTTRSTEELPGVDYAYRLALDAGLLSWEGRRVVPGPHAELVRDDPLEQCLRLVIGVLGAVGPTAHRYRVDTYGFGWYADDVDEHLGAILISLYRDGDAEVDELHELIWEDLLATYDLDDVDDAKLAFHCELVDSALRTGLDRLAELGVVELAGEQREVGRYGSTGRSGGVVSLTPLGNWAVWRLVSTFAEAPAAGQLRDAGAVDLLRAAADLPEDLARAEIAAWTAHNGERAASDLCGALAAGLDDTARSLAFRALLSLGDAAADAVSGLADHPDLAPHVTVWRVDTRSAGPDEMDRSGDPAGWVALVHAVVDLWGPAAAAAAWAVPAAGAPGIEAMLEAAWRVTGPHTEEVLAAVGDHHPDKRVAKAARKALFKHRSST